MKRFLVFCCLAAVGTSSAFASLDSGLIALIPANSKMVAGIDVQKCKTSEFGQFLLSRSQANDPHFEEFMNETGLDPRRDLESLVMTTSGDGKGSNQPFAILARGVFDESKIRSLAMSKGAVAEQYQGVNLLVSKDHGQDVAFAFPDTGVAVIGDVGSVHQVVQNLATAAALDIELTNRIQAAGQANDAWFVSATGGAMLGKEFASHSGGQIDSQAQVLQSIRAANGGVRFGPVVAVSFDATTRSAKDATSLSDVFRFMASMVQMKRQDDPRAGIMASSLDNMKLATEGDTVHVGFTMTEKNLEQIADSGATHKH